ncbi:MAG: translation initiation factor IF-2, partial [Clostridiaceae bacterium]
EEGDAALIKELLLDKNKKETIDEIDIEEKYEDLVVDNIKVKKIKKQKIEEVEPIKVENVIEEKANNEIEVGETITVKDLADKIKKPYNEVIKQLIFLGIMAAINQDIDFDTAEKLLAKFEFKAIKKEEASCIVKEDNDSCDALDDEKRPAVVTVMGHVDHGKTSLLDSVRKAKVTESEAGGITQHIGAYTVDVTGEKITFLDTPGHEAFTSMRARGAQITDIVVLVVAADDGIMPQTEEAINHCKAANVPVIVAINKIDRPGANIDKVKQELTEFGLVAEDWGGDIICVPVSAKTGEGIDTLLEMIVLTSEMLELKGNSCRNAKGTVIEAKLDKGRGPVASLLVQNGTLKVGDSIICGNTYGRIRAMFDDNGKKIKKAGPSIPVEILGLSEVPAAGDRFTVVTNEKCAREMANKKIEEKRDEFLQNAHKISLEDLYSQIKEGKVKELNIIIKADVQGSVEALKQSLEKISSDEVKVRIIHSGVGAITETDVTLATASSAIIIGFNVRPDLNASVQADKDKVDIKNYRVIYNAIDDVKSAMIGMLDPDLKEVVLGRAEVRQIYKISNVGTIVGCYVQTGKLVRNESLRVIRNGIVITESTFASLKRFKDDAKEVQTGFECGVGVEKFNDLRELDIIECYTMEEIKKKTL